MKILGLAVLALLIVGAGALYLLAQKSKAGAPPGITDGALASCPSSPNCVSSEAGGNEAHRVTAFPLAVWDQLPDAIQKDGGRIVDVKPDYIAAEYSSKLLGFVDDVEFRKAADAVHVRSASRVGYGDGGVNRKRVEALRKALTGAEQ